MIVRELNTIRPTGTTTPAGRLRLRFRRPLPGPRHFLEHYAIERAACFNRPRDLSVALFDVDRFHEFNEMLSPRAADEVLGCVADVIADATRDIGLVVRFEGDRFLSSWPGADEATALELVERILVEARACRMLEATVHRPVELRVGLVTCDPRETASAHAVLERARAALSHCKLHRQRRVTAWSAIRHMTGTTQGTAPDPLDHAAANLGRIRAQLHDMVEQSTRALVAAVEAKDPFTSRHSTTVAQHADALGRRLRLSPRQGLVLHQAAVLHDVGKIGVPDAILTKPGPLTDEEFLVVQRHPRTAMDILGHLPGLRSALPLILHHHERFDGQGYPDGLAGERIPFGARILAVADSMDAMLSRRSYKDAYSVDRVIDELRAGAGRQFDPIVARAGVEHLRLGGMV